MSFIWGLVVVLALSMGAPATKEPVEPADFTGKVVIKADQDGTRIVLKGNKKVICEDEGLCLYIGGQIGTD